MEISTYIWIRCEIRLKVTIILTLPFMGMYFMALHVGYDGDEVVGMCDKEIMCQRPPPRSLPHWPFCLYVTFQYVLNRRQHRQSFISITINMSFLTKGYISPLSHHKQGIIDTNTANIKCNTKFPGNRDDIQGHYLNTSLSICWWTACNHRIKGFQPIIDDILTYGKN